MTNATNQYFFPMQNLIQDYAWGSRTSINALFGIENSDDKPQAEIWMGAHPNGSSKVVDGSESHLLSDFINQDISRILAVKTATQFGELPYLFKILAAQSPLSIQVHPSKKQAELGFQREEEAKIPRNDSNRSYKDPNHKPELVYALTEYQAMNGFRVFSEILKLIKQVNVTAITDLVNTFDTSTNEKGLEELFSGLLSLEGEVKENAIAELLAYAETNKDNDTFALILELAELYPSDIGVFMPLMLNVLTLQPGEAMFLNACTPHAYLKGTGLEIMANSDNVLRAGLTHKFIDVHELVACTTFQEKSADSLLTRPIEKDGGLFFPVPVNDFKFAVFMSADNLPIRTQSAEILLAMDAELTLTHSDGESITIRKGESVFVPAYTNGYQLSSQGRVARAFN
ncbi:mannose-6-phosphate isomerase, class I [Vibrio sp. JC009]|uniref:mannose-6-phosphate isomerase, class I n=1 Tax=Vibrio sp. JC009 TaxID=2912314 RepID=UPI0023B185D5|nr:mannose-6-phosphate isomerase, class I [Vibrio sp. JC009]WED24937.1 mannose-6-phosphate isomerase, class I [Vibrio sp. JC009]